MRKIGVVTSSRADYGIYRSVLEKIQRDSHLELLLFVTGMHLSGDYGNSVDMIEQDGFPIVARVDVLLSDTPGDIARAMGKGTMGFAKVFEESRPDILLVLGDRFEMHAAAVAAIPFGIPIAHIHGGELTYGAFDEYFRHSLTKLSDLHFASIQVYANRIKQMGEQEDRVFVVGAPGLDYLQAFESYSSEELEKEYNIDLSRPALLVTFHPVTMEQEKTQEYIENLLGALEGFSQYSIIFTQPNADPNNHLIFQSIKAFLDNHKNAFRVDNFGQKGYFSMMKEAKAMVGNSSSGIIEAASFQLPVVNIGTRQEGRVRARNVIDVGYFVDEIKKGIAAALAEDFKSSLSDVVNPYGDGKACGKIVAILDEINLQEVKHKNFRDIQIFI